MTAPRSHARQALAAEIDSVAAVQAEIESIDAALEKLGSPYLDNEIAAAKAAVAEADAREPRRLVDELLGRPAGQSPTEARAALDAIVAEQTRHLAARNLIWEERKALEQRLEWAEQRRRAAVGPVIRDSAEVARLLAEFDATRARLDELETLFSETLLSGMPDGYGRWDREAARKAPGTLAVVSPWAAAIAALATDPDAPLPGDPDAPPGMAVAA